MRVWTAGALPANDGARRVIDIGPRAVGIGAPFRPPERYERWLQLMMGELYKKQGKERDSYHHLLSVMVDGRYRLHVQMLRRSSPEAWRDLFGVEEAILFCPCVDVALCHRRPLAQLLRAEGVQHLGEIR
jgi:hypothetical protein